MPEFEVFAGAKRPQTPQIRAFSHALSSFTLYYRVICIVLIFAKMSTGYFPVSGRHSHICRQALRSRFFKIMLKPSFRPCRQAAEKSIFMSVYSEAKTGLWFWI
jgi:hypothetical protein